MNTAGIRTSEGRSGTPDSRKALLARRVLLIGGLLLFGILVLHFGRRGLFDMAVRLGPGLVILLVFPMAGVQACFFAGWWLCFGPKDRRVGFSGLLAAHLIGEAFNTVTLLANLGGEPMKARLLRPRLALRESMATVIVARTVRTVAQALFLAGGVAFALLRLPMDRRLEFGLVAFALALAVGVLTFGRMQRHDIFSRALAFLQRLGLFVSTRRNEAVRDLDGRLRERYTRGRVRLAASLVVQLAGFALGAVEVWIACRLLGHPVTADQALLAETLGLGISTLFFVVPGGLGVSEGGRAAVFALMGLDPALGFAVGLVRRLRDLTWAGLGLAVYALAGADR